MITRMYLVVAKDLGVKKLVEASSQARAVSAVVEPAFTVTIPTQKEVVQLMREGVEVVSDPPSEPL